MLGKELYKIIIFLLWYHLFPFSFKFKVLNFELITHLLQPASIVSEDFPWFLKLRQKSKRQDTHGKSPLNKTN